ncbi:hypothetical protein LO762_05785 [Actinocorallia sp. API 0066]|uniref:hypothetical protein n=1 Tax=Actinocorallia sp. API 0066 TaxID=2896846 RepID=UPI001E51B300|nr:hypothetical protein [Actinocorallia sp. API 0066]MCD0448706.1 hypothetical protein [Actinocorallia sp. API 0066]
MTGDWAAVVGAAGVFLLAIVTVWQVAVTWRARYLAAREERYKELAAKYAALLDDVVVLQRQTQEDLSEARKSLASMERMMREIE